MPGVGQAREHPKAGCRRVVVTRSAFNVFGGTVWSVMAQLSWCWGKNADGKQVVLGDPSGGMGPQYLGQAWFCGWRVIPPGNPAQPGDDISDMIDGAKKFHFRRQLYLELNSALWAAVTLQVKVPFIDIEVDNTGQFDVKTGD